jgi:hypothetical protein
MVGLYIFVILTDHVDIVVKLQDVLARIRSGCVENNIYTFKVWIYKKQLYIKRAYTNAIVLHIREHIEMGISQLCCLSVYPLVMYSLSQQKNAIIIFRGAN